MRLVSLLRSSPSSCDLTTNYIYNDDADIDIDTYMDMDIMDTIWIHRAAVPSTESSFISKALSIFAEDNDDEEEEDTLFIMSKHDGDDDDDNDDDDDDEPDTSFTMPMAITNDDVGILGIPRRRLGYSTTTDAVVSVLTFICFGVTLSTGTIYYT